MKKLFLLLVFVLACQFDDSREVYPQQIISFAFWHKSEAHMNEKSDDIDEMMNFINYDMFGYTGLFFDIDFKAVIHEHINVYDANEPLEFFELYNPNADNIPVVYVDKIERDSGCGFIGYAQSLSSCEKIISMRIGYSKHEKTVLAHEIGHLFGLSHSSDKNNLMYPSSAMGKYITEEQKQAFNSGAWKYYSKCVSPYER